MPIKPFGTKKLFVIIATIGFLKLSVPLLRNISEFVIDRHGLWFEATKLQFCIAWCNNEILGFIIPNLDPPNYTYGQSECTFGHPERSRRATIRDVKMHSTWSSTPLRLTCLF